MQLRFLKSKLHLATVRQTHLDYHGSITIAEDLMEAVGFFPYEAVLIGNTATGARAETYVLKGKRGSGEIQLNGAMARLAQPGDRIIIMSFVLLEPSEIPGHKPKVAILDEKNRVVEKWEG